MLEPLAAGDDGGGLGLGAAVQLDDPLGAEPLDPGVLEPGRAGLGQVPHDAERRQVVAPRGRRWAAARCASSSSARGRRRRRGGARWPPGWPRRRTGAARRRGCRASSAVARPDDRTVVVERAGHDQAAVGLDQQERRRPRRRAMAGAPATMSFGRPVEPPEVGAFHAGDVRSGCGSSAFGARPRSWARSSAGTPARRTRPRPPRGPPADRPARRWRPAPARAGVTTPAEGWRRASSAATSATNHSTELGRAMVTMSPGTTPSAASSWANRSARRLELGAGHALVAAGDRGPVGCGRDARSARRRG